MERERSFEGSRIRLKAETARQITYLRSPEGLREYLDRPENREELVAYFDYLVQLSSFVQTLPPDQQIDGLRALDFAITRSVYASALDVNPQTSVAITRPPSHTTLPPTTRTIHVGEHMDVILGLHAASHWPNGDKESLTLTDGAVVSPQTPIGLIDYYRNIRQLTKEGNLIRFSRELIDSATESLGLLAQQYQRFGNQPAKPDAFTGMSHLARLAHRFGFTVFDIADDGKRIAATHTSFGFARRIGLNNREWNRFSSKYKPAKVAMISAPELVRRYS